MHLVPVRLSQRLGAQRSYNSASLGSNEVRILGSARIMIPESFVAINEEWESGVPLPPRKLADLRGWKAPERRGVRMLGRKVLGLGGVLVEELIVPLGEEGELPWLFGDSLPCPPSETGWMGFPRIGVWGTEPPTSKEEATSKDVSPPGIRNGDPAGVVLITVRFREGIGC